MHSRGSSLLTPFLRQDLAAFGQCRLYSRAFSASANANSGHNKWSSIKHDKARADIAKNRQRSIASQSIINASKFYGPDPTINLRLASAIASAKKAGIPKNVIETAIARGQGRSATGVALETVNIEAILPPGIATVIECQTDNKIRTLNDIRHLVKQHNGSATPTLYLFQKKGKIGFVRRPGLLEEEVLDAALEAGALDVVDNENELSVYTEPEETKAVAESLAQTLQLDIESTEMLWDPNVDTMAAVEDANDADNFNRFLERLSDQYGFQRIYTNFDESISSGQEEAEAVSRATA